MQSPHELVNMLAQATVSVPLSKWFSGHNGTRKDTRKLSIAYRTHSPHEHVDTLAQATVLCPPFCPPFEMVLGTQEDNKEHRGRQETGRFY